MAPSEFLMSSQINRFYFTQYSSTLATFKTALAADWSATLPAGFEVLATVAAPTIAILVLPTGTFYVNPTDWVGYSAALGWQVIPNSKMAGLLYTPATV